MIEWSIIAVLLAMVVVLTVALYQARTMRPTKPTVVLYLSPGGLLYSHSVCGAVGVSKVLTTRPNDWED